MHLFELFVRHFVIVFCAQSSRTVRADNIMSCRPPPPPPPDHYDAVTSDEEDARTDSGRPSAIKGDLPLDRLLKLSKSFKTDVERHLNMVKEERMSMINEMQTTEASYTMLPDERTYEITPSYPVRKSTNKPEELQINIPNSAIGKRDEHVDIESQREKGDFHLRTPFVQNLIERPRQMNINLDETTSDRNSEYLKKILTVEKKCQRWMHKYDDLYNKYLRLESKCMDVEKENCNYQMELARIKMIEEENLRLTQAVNKTEHVRKELESALESSHEVVYKYQTDIEVARNKVKEAVEIVEKTSSEKELLAIDLKKSKDEIARLENELKDLIQEAGKRVSLEVEKVKNLYKNKLREANIEIEYLHTEKQIACNKTEQLLKELEALNKKNDFFNQKLVNESDVYTKKEALHIQKNKEYESINENLTAEVEFLNETNRKLQESYARKKTKFIMEITFLNDTVKSLENNLKRATNEISKNNETIVKATDRIKYLEIEISKLREPADNDTEQKNMQINKLTKNIENLKQMWGKEMHNMIEGFNRKINDLKQRYSKLFKFNVKLKRKIHSKKTNFASKKRRKYKSNASRNEKSSNTTTTSTST